MKKFCLLILLILINTSSKAEDPKLFIEIAIGYQIDLISERLLDYPTDLKFGVDWKNGINTYFHHASDITKRERGEELGAVRDAIMISYRREW